MPRLGLYLGRLPGFDKSGFNKQELIECVRAADACGYDSFWLPEAWERDAFTLLTELALRTGAYISARASSMSSLEVPVLLP